MGLIGAGRHRDLADFEDHVNDITLCVAPLHALQMFSSCSYLSGQYQSQLLDTYLDQGVWSPLRLYSLLNDGDKALMKSVNKIDALLLLALLFSFS